MLLQVRQKTLPTQIGAGDGDFVATPNYRNEIMLKEAGDFANHLKRCEKDIRAMKNITEGKFSCYFAMPLII